MLRRDCTPKSMACYRLDIVHRHGSQYGRSTDGPQESRRELDRFALSEMTRRYPVTTVSSAATMLLHMSAWESRREIKEPCIQLGWL